MARLQAHDVITLAPVNVGDRIETFRHEPGALHSVQTATVNGRSGKVGVILDALTEAQYPVDYWYASVVGLYVVDLESQAFCEASNGHDWYSVSDPEGNRDRSREGCHRCGMRHDVPVK